MLLLVQRNKNAVLSNERLSGSPWRVDPFVSNGRLQCGHAP